MFFVLSGFLIAYIYLPLKIENRSGMKVFLGRRFARIFPLYLLITFAYYFFVIVRDLHQPGFMEIFLNLSLLKGLSDQYLFTGIMQAWSLTVEESFYLLSPLIFLLIRQKKIFWLQLPFFFMAGMGMVYFFKQLNLPFFERMEFMWFTTFFGRCTEFFLGIHLAKMTLTGNLKLKSGYMVTLTGGMATTLIIVFMSFLQKPFGVLHSVNATPGLLVNNFLLPLAIFFFLRGLLTERTLVSRTLSTGMLQLLGKSSYALYLVHAGIFADYFLRFSKGNIWIQFLVVQAFAILLFKLFEQPVNNYLKRRFFNENILVKMDPLTALSITSMPEQSSIQRPSR